MSSGASIALRHLLMERISITNGATATMQFDVSGSAVLTSAAIAQASQPALVVVRAVDPVSQRELQTLLWLGGNMTIAVQQGVGHLLALQADGVTPIPGAI